MNVTDANQAMYGTENLIHASHVLKLNPLRLTNAQSAQEQFQTMMSTKNITFVNNVLMVGSQWQVNKIVWNLLITVTMISLNMRLFLMKEERKSMNALCVTRDISGTGQQETVINVQTFMLTVINAQDMVKNAQVVVTPRSHQVMDRLVSITLIIVLIMERMILEN